MPSQVTHSKHKRGIIMPIGGAEEKEQDPVILQAFVELAKDAVIADEAPQGANIVIIPTASQTPVAGRIYQDLFLNMGAKTAICLEIDCREDGSNPDYLNAIQGASAVFITGGNQLRLSTMLGGTPLMQLIRTRNADGLLVAGTSAGAAILAEHMIAGGVRGITPTHGGAILAPGMGLTNCMIIDQHFGQRERLGRLLSALSLNPFLLGIGIDEDTALVIEHDNTATVLGSGCVTIADPSQLQYTNVDQCLADKPIAMVGMQVHILTAGMRYDLSSHTYASDHATCSMQKAR